MNDVFDKKRINKRLKELNSEKQHRVELKFNDSHIKVINGLAKNSVRSRKNFLEHIVTLYCIEHEHEVKKGKK